jgi:hypothetical protein
VSLPHQVNDQADGYPAQQLSRRRFQGLLMSLQTQSSGQYDFTFVQLTAQSPKAMRTMASALPDVAMTF